MIPENNHITWSAEDIRRYWSGQLSAEEMHAMEKAALDDPFLADAMEGYGEALKEKGDASVFAQLNKLHEQVQAQSATNKRIAPVRSFPWWKLAAAAIVLVVTALWIFTGDENKRQSEIATVENARKQDAAARAARDSAAAENYAGATQKAEQELKNTPGENTRDIAKQQDAAGERGLSAFQTKPPDQHFDSSPAYRSRRSTFNLSRPDTQKSDDKPSAAPAIVSAASPLSIKDTAEPKREMEVVVLSDGYKKPADRKSTDADKEKLQNFVSGVVTDNKNNPLANAYLQINNFNNQYTTDLRGQFKIPVQDTVVKVNVTVPGYTTAQFQLKSSYDGAGYVTDNKLQLQPQGNQGLQEVMVNANQKFARKKEMAKSLDEKDGYIPTVMSQDAQPVYGWVGYEQYLAENKRRPQDNPHLVGEVVISFMVDKKQQISDFKVEKSLSPQHDVEALRLVREGPPWKLRKGRKARATVIVRF